MSSSAILPCYSTNRSINSIKFITLFLQPQGRPHADAISFVSYSSTGEAQLKVHAAHARVEGGLRCIKAIFDTLHNSWAKGEEQLNALVWTAVGIANACR